ncbi:hypothetical protein TorRG33x02_177990 [Trema orientale]|uniref:Uncharacterized protein n=1 Tax=Trema orientale TaxID=63057 RepID=A0A2P5ELM5_TREOI|nr:hypothetical protein TorRG33x02_177990 [Trema orientale]
MKGKTKEKGADAQIKIIFSPLTCSYQCERAIWRRQ